MGTQICIQEGPHFEGVGNDSARLDDVIETVFEQYPAIRLRPFSFLSRRQEIVSEAAAKARVSHPLLSDFLILPKFTLNAKVIELRDGDSRIGLFVTLGMRYGIDADLSALQAEGVDVADLYAVWRKVQPGQRRLVGRIQTLNDGVVLLSEATIAESTVAAADIRLGHRLISSQPDSD